MKYYKNLLAIVLMSTLGICSSFGMNESTFDESKFDWMNQSTLGEFPGQPNNQPFPQRPLSYFSDATQPILERALNLNTTDLTFEQKRQQLNDLYREHTLIEPKETPENTRIIRKGSPSEFKKALNQWLKTDRILRKEIENLAERKKFPINLELPIEKTKQPILEKQPKQLPIKKRQHAIIHPRQKTPAEREKIRQEQVAAALQMQAKAEVRAMEQEKEQELLKSLPLPERIYTIQQKINTEMPSLAEAISNGADVETIKQKSSVKSLQSAIMEHLSSALKTLEQDSRNTEKHIEEINHIKLKIATARTFIDFHNLQLQMATGNNKETVKKSINNFLTEFIKIADILENPTISFDKYDEFIILYIIKSDLFIKMTQSIPTDKNEAFQSAYQIIKLILSEHKPKAYFFVRPVQKEPIEIPAEIPHEPNPAVVPIENPIEPQVQPIIPAGQPPVVLPVVPPQPAPTNQPPVPPAPQPFLITRIAISLWQGMKSVGSTIVSTISWALNGFASLFR